MLSVEMQTMSHAKWGSRSRSAICKFSQQAIRQPGLLALCLSYAELTDLLYLALIMRVNQKKKKDPSKLMWGNTTNWFMFFSCTVLLWELTSQFWENKISPQEGYSARQSEDSVYEVMSLVIFCLNPNHNQAHHVCTRFVHCHIRIVATKFCSNTPSRTAFSTFWGCKFQRWRCTKNVTSH